MIIDSHPSAVAISDEPQINDMHSSQCQKRNIQQPGKLLLKTSLKNDKCGSFEAKYEEMRLRTEVSVVTHILCKTLVKPLELTLKVFNHILIVLFSLLCQYTEAKLQKCIIVLNPLDITVHQFFHWGLLLIVVAVWTLQSVFLISLM